MEKVVVRCFLALNRPDPSCSKTKNDREGGATWEGPCGRGHVEGVLKEGPIIQTAPHKYVLAQFCAEGMNDSYWVALQ